MQRLHCHLGHACGLQVFEGSGQVFELFSLLLGHLAADFVGGKGPADLVAGEAFLDFRFQVLVSVKGRGAGAERGENNGGFSGFQLGLRTGSEPQDDQENRKPAKE